MKVWGLVRHENEKKLPFVLTRSIYCNDHYVQIMEVFCMEQADPVRAESESSTYRSIFLVLTIGGSRNLWRSMQQRAVLARALGPKAGTLNRVVRKLPIISMGISYQFTDLPWCKLSMNIQDHAISSGTICQPASGLLCKLQLWSK